MTNNIETSFREIHDPFLNKTVKISDRLVDRLRGRYAVGPTMENGEPEFGWRQHETPPIQHEAAVVIEALQDVLKMISENGTASDSVKELAEKAIQGTA